MKKNLHFFVFSQGQPLNHIIYGRLFQVFHETLIDKAILKSKVQCENCWQVFVLLKYDFVIKNRKYGEKKIFKNTKELQIKF